MFQLAFRKALAPTLAPPTILNTRMDFFESDTVQDLRMLPKVLSSGLSSKLLLAIPFARCADLAIFPLSCPWRTQTSFHLAGFSQ
jgi:hypothetical protein